MVVPMYYLLGADCSYKQYYYTQEGLIGTHAFYDVLINPQALCVDMVYIVDISSSMAGYMEGIKYLASQLPDYGNACFNRYGLTVFGASFSQNSTVSHIQVNDSVSDYFGSSIQLSNSLTNISASANNTDGSEDGYMAIHSRIQIANFRSGVKRIFVLFVDTVSNLHITNILFSFTVLACCLVLPQYGRAVKAHTP